MSDFLEGLCHVAAGAWEQRAIWPIRWGGDLGDQIGRLTVGFWPGHWVATPDQETPQVLNGQLQKKQREKKKMNIS